MPTSMKDLILYKLTATTLILGTATTLILGQFISYWIANTIYPGFPTYTAGMGLQFLGFLTAGIIFFWTISNLAPGESKEGLTGLLTIGVFLAVIAVVVSKWVLPLVFPQLGPFWAVVPIQFDLNLAPFAVVPMP